MENFRVSTQLETAGIERGVPFEFSFESIQITAYNGETIGAALIAAGIKTLRHTRRRNKPRGFFCGIGICFDCLVVVDGKPNMRACLTPARPGADVRLQTGTGEDFYNSYAKN